MHCSRASGARRPTGTPTRRPQSPRARSRCSSRSGSTSPVPQARVASVRGALGPVAARFHGDPSRALRVLGVTGTNGKTTTTYLLEAIARARTANATGASGPSAPRIGGDERAARCTPRPRRPSSRRRSHACATRGVTTVAMEVSSHALEQHRVDGDALRGGVLHEPLARPPRLPRHDGRVLRGQGAPVRRRRSRRAAAHLARRPARPRACAAGARGRPRRRGRSRSTTRRPTSARRDVELDADGTRVHARVPSRRRNACPSSRTLVGPFNVANVLAAAATARAARYPARRRSSPGSRAPVVVPGRFERVDARPGLHGARRLRAHARRARARARRRPRDAHRPGGRRVGRVRLRR